MPAYPRREQHGSSNTHHVSAASVDGLVGMLDKATLGSPPITRITVPTPTSPSGANTFPGALGMGGGASEATTPEMVRSSRSSGASQSLHQQLYNHQNHHLSSMSGGGSSVTHDVVYEFDDDVPEVEDGNALDELWGSLRQRKEKKMSREKPKVLSLESRSKSSRGPAPPDLTSSNGNGVKGLPVVDMPPPTPSAEEPEQQQLLLSPPVPPPPIPAGTVEPSSEPQNRSSEVSGAQRRRAVQRQKSVTSFRESPDGRTMVASIDMRGVQKENVHVSFQRTRLVVTWALQEITDWEEENGLWVRERHTKEYQRTFPLPEGTRFDEIASAMSQGGKHLLLRYPSCRSFRVENREDSY